MLERRQALEAEKAARAQELKQRAEVARQRVSEQASASKRTGAVQGCFRPETDFTVTSAETPLSAAAYLLAASVTTLHPCLQSLRHCCCCGR